MADDRFWRSGFRPAVALLVGLFAGVAPLSAQVTGRWRVVFSQSGREVHGDLRLHQGADSLRGTLLLDTNDSFPDPITGRMVTGDSLVFQTMGREVVAFSGRIIVDQMYGDVVLGRGGSTTRWTADRLAVDADIYIPFPRFVLRQILGGRTPAEIVVPGPWLRAARVAGFTPARVVRDYRREAKRAGLEPLADSIFSQAGLLRAMGVYQRDELLATSHTTLTAIRRQIQDDTTLARFDALFRPRGRWLSDIHDVALERIQRKFPAITWESVAPVVALGLGQSSLPSGTARVPWALYRLYTIQQSDSVRFNTLMTQMRMHDAQASAALAKLLQGYREAIRWYAQVMQFFVHDRWFGQRSLDDRISGVWDFGPDHTGPEIHVHVFGYPEGTARITPADTVVALVVHPENWTARAWFERQGWPTMARVLGRFPAASGEPILDLDETTFLLNTIQQRREQRVAGFLEPVDAIVVDPSYAPLLAIGTIVHEWLHILFEQARQTASPPLLEQGMVRLIPADPFLAEGMAEWLAARALLPLTAELPLVALGEAEKRASMAVTRPDDPHLQGYLMIGTLALVVPDHRDLVARLIRHATDPSAIIKEVPVAEAWAKYRGAPDRTLPVTGRRYLIPEVEFYIDGEIPVVIQERITVPSEAVQ